MGRAVSRRGRGRLAGVVSLLVVSLRRSKVVAKRAFHSAVASERLAAVIGGFSVGSGCESQTQTEEPPMTDEMMNLHARVRRPLTPIFFAI